MDKTEKVKEQFLSDIKSHEMRIIKNDNEYRHIRFSQPGNSNYHFFITTWPNHLCISGDVGCYVFSRLNDMFSFFRKKELNIDPRYWKEKCVSGAVPEGIKEFSTEALRESLTDFHDSYFCEDEDSGSIEALNAWNDIKEQIINQSYSEWEAVAAINNFKSDYISLADIWYGFNMEKYTPHYLWCLYAIVWGIMQYDKVQEQLKIKEQ